MIMRFAQNFDLEVYAAQGVFLGLLLFLFCVELYNLFFHRNVSVIYLSFIFILEILVNGPSTTLHWKFYKIRCFLESDKKIQAELTRMKGITNHYLYENGVFRDPLQHENTYGLFIPLKQEVGRKENQYTDLLIQKETLIEQKALHSTKILQQEVLFQQRKTEIDTILPVIVHQLDSDIFLLQILEFLIKYLIPSSKNPQKELLQELRNISTQIANLRRKKKKWKHVRLLDHEKRLYHILADKQKFSFIFSLYKSHLLRQEIKPNNTKLTQNKNTLQNQLQQMMGVFEKIEERKLINEQKKSIQKYQRRLTRETKKIENNITTIQADIQRIHSMMQDIIDNRDYLHNLSQIKLSLTKDIQYLTIQKERIGEEKARRKIKEYRSILDQLDQEKIVVRSKNQRSRKNFPISSLLV